MVAAVQPKNQILSKTLDALDRVALNERAKVFCRLVASHDAAIGDADGFDFLSNDVTSERRSNRFYFG